MFAPRRDARKPSSDAFCPSCGSAERHRLAYFALKDRLVGLSRTLHFAPEPSIERWLRSVSAEYTSCDLDPSAAMEQENITHLTYEDERFDFIWCSNVLEHVPNDRAAMRELYRVLTLGGLCVIQVPIWRKTTFEDPSITSEEDRKEHFGQHDHVRLYGLDIADRLEAQGFAVDIVTSRDFDPRDVGRFAMDHLTTREIFLCRRANGSVQSQL